MLTKDFWWKRMWGLLLAVLLFPVLPVMAVPTGGGGELQESDGSEDEPETDSEGDDEDDEPESDDEWDPERAMSTIRKLREVEKTSKRQVKELQAKLKKLEEAEAKRQEQEMSALERAQAELAEAQTRADQLETELLDLRLKQAFADAIAGAELQFVDPKAREAAFLLALPELEVDDDGSNAEQVVKALKKEHGYLFGSKARGAPNIDGEKRGKNKKGYDPDTIRARYGI